MRTPLHLRKKEQDSVKNYILFPDMLRYRNNTQNTVTLISYVRPYDNKVDLVSGDYHLKIIL